MPKISVNQNNIVLLSHITPRHQIEQEFFDCYANTVKVDKVNLDSTFTRISRENQYILRRIGNLAGKKVLDLGCGIGDASVAFARRGATVSGIDISKKMVEIASALARKAEHRITIKQMNAEKLLFENETFDLVYGRGILHHVNITLTTKEVFRVLKKDGKAIFVEPLAHNPMIKIYDKVADSIRSPVERRISSSEIDGLSNLFSSVYYRGLHLFTLPVFGLYYLNKARKAKADVFWFQDIERGECYRNLYIPLQWMDNLVLTALPFLRKYCWKCVIECVK